MLRQIIYAAPQQIFEEDTSPSHFQDEEVQRSVEKLNLNYGQSAAPKSVTKKRKVTPESNPVLNLFKAIYETLDVAWTGNEAALLPEDLFLWVSHSPLRLPRTNALQRELCESSQ